MAENPYRQKKKRDLTAAENAYIRTRLDQDPNVNSVLLAIEVGCTPQQVCGVKAARTRGQ